MNFIEVIAQQCNYCEGGDQDHEKAAPNLAASWGANFDL